MDRFYFLSLSLLLLGTSSAQVLSFPASNPAAMTTRAGLNLLQTTVMDSNLALINGLNQSPLQNPAAILSKLDLKAPGKARQEYEKGYQALARKDFGAAISHLNNATRMYPNYVAAFNALGAAHLGMGQTTQATSAFTEAIALDDHLPNSYLNRGCAELASSDYANAEHDIARASAMAPLDLQVKAALAYGQYMNKDYPAAIATAGDVHARRHEGAALVHFYAAAAWEAQGNPAYAERELRLLMKEDPKSPAALQAKSLLQQLQDEVSHPRRSAHVDSEEINLTSHVSLQLPLDSDDAERKQQQEQKELAQIADAEALDPALDNGATEEGLPAAGPDSVGDRRGYTFHTSTEEVAILFAATDRGNAVPDLNLSDIKIRDNHHAPAVITGFRSEGELPLRIGLVIDTSASVAARFKFEQEAAGDFLRKVVTGPNDLGFVVGFSNSVLLAQDFTHDASEMAHSLAAFAPLGGTSLWDAVRFASEKLKVHPESRPVARILVVISDGEDNSSSGTAKDAIQRAQSDEVTVYTINTMELTDHSDQAPVGVRALKTLATLTGGTAFTPGSVRWLDGSLNELRQVIRSRYLITYKPGNLQRDGKYRSVELTAQKDGRKLRVFARKGYFVPESRSEK